MKRLNKFKFILLAIMLIGALFSCKKTNKMPEQNQPTNIPVINKYFEGKWKINGKQDTVEIVFLKEIQKDSNEYVVKNIFNAIKQYLKTPTSITDKDYNIVSDEQIKHAVYLNNIIKFDIFANGNLVITSNELVVASLSFIKQ